MGRATAGRWYPLTGAFNKQKCIYFSDMDCGNNKFSLYKLATKYRASSICDIKDGFALSIVFCGLNLTCLEENHGELNLLEINGNIQDRCSMRYDVQSLSRGGWRFRPR